MVSHKWLFSIEMYVVGCQGLDAVISSVTTEQFIAWMSSAIYCICTSCRYLSVAEYKETSEK